MKGKNVILSLILISCFILFGYYYKSMYVSNSIEAINMKAMNKKYVYPLGEIVGIKATTDGVLVIGYEEENIEYIGGIEKGDNIIAINDIKIENNSIIYIDPPYKGTQDYGFNFDYIEYINKYKDISKIYVSEGYPIDGATNNILISKGRSKGNINGKIKKKPIEEWLNIFAK